MQNKLSKSDQRRIDNFTNILKNANTLLKWKSVEEINAFFDEQDKILKYVNDTELREKALNGSKELRDTAISMTIKFKSSIDKMTNSKKILEWKSLNEVTDFFDKIDKDISAIPDMRMRHLLLQKSQYFRWRNCDDLFINSTQKTLDEVSNNSKLAWNNKDEIESFFDSINKDISKIWDKTIASMLLSYSDTLKSIAIQSIRFNLN